MTATARALWTTGPGRFEIRSQSLPVPGDGEVLVTTLQTAVSRGTETLIATGSVPESEYQRMKAPFQEGDFPFPVKYGYAAVGQTPDGTRVFALHPHQDRFVLPRAALRPVPDTVPTARAVLAANMETALNVLWDAGAGPGDRITVIGAGLVGLLAARLARRLPGAVVQIVDRDAGRGDQARALDLDFRAPDAATPDRDIVINASASGAGLDQALALAGFEATVVEASWHGSRPVSLHLGHGFHARRLRLISSQVGHVAAGRRARLTHADRLDMALGLLDDPVLDALVVDAVAFDQAPARLPGHLSGTGPDPALTGTVLRLIY
ncbi:zinc-binding alcohol dehydrogenase [Tistrella sp. BH-R2-4]|uniref:Zinc-binding alcohol dehydrogenase n=1 Tax=Tistrella arctica TaxID=3133430 RepID=A0ABU9YGP9_9PROT